MLSACSSEVILCARVYVLFVSNYFQFTTPKNNNNNNKIKDTYLIPGKLTQTSYQNTRATDRRLKYLDWRINSRVSAMDRFVSGLIGLRVTQKNDCKDSEQYLHRLKQKS